MQVCWQVVIELEIFRLIRQDVAVFAWLHVDIARRCAVGIRVRILVLMVVKVMLKYLIVLVLLVVFLFHFVWGHNIIRTVMVVFLFDFDAFGNFSWRRRWGPDTDWIVSIVSDAIVLLLLVSIVKFELDMLDDECCFLFSFTPLCKVLQRVWAAFMRELRLTIWLWKVF